MKNRYLLNGNNFGTFEVKDIRTKETLYEGSQEECELEIDRLETLHKDIINQMEYFNGGKENNMVDKPNHYIGDLGLEVETVLRNFLPRYEDAYVAHRVASAIEYLLRSPLKNGTQDLEKASYNLQQALEHIKKGE